MLKILEPHVNDLTKKTVAKFFAISQFTPSKFIAAISKQTDFNFSNSYLVTPSSNLINRVQKENFLKALHDEDSNHLLVVDCDDDKIDYVSLTSKTEKQIVIIRKKC